MDFVDSGNGSGFGNLEIDQAGNFIVVGGKQSYTAKIIDRYNNDGGRIPAGLQTIGFVLKINSDGTYSNNYGYVDSVSFDSTTALTIDTYGNIIMGFKAGDDIIAAEKTCYIYDKNGYVTSIRSSDDPFSGILKYNANFTLNKISL
jgi:hypothetical protein